MLLLVPYQVNTLFQRNPWGNLGLLVATTAVSLAAFFGGLPDTLIDQMVLDGWSAPGLLGHQFLHGGLLHLIGNMLFLFVFGNAVCGVMSSWLYVAVYLTIGVSAGSMHVLFDGSPAIGASGAIAGVVGLYLAIYPTNSIRCFWFFLLRGGLTEVAGWILIAGWFLLDLYGALKPDSDNVAYFAHLGGTVAGFALGMWLLSKGWIDLFEYDHPTLPQLLAARKAKA